MSHAPDGVRVYNLNGVNEEFPEVRWVTFQNGALILERSHSDAPGSGADGVQIIFAEGQWSRCVGLPNPETGRMRKLPAVDSDLGMFKTPKLPPEPPTPRGRKA